MTEVKRVTVDKGAFKKPNKDKFELRVSEVELPELNEFMGLENGDIAVVKVKQMELSDFLRIKGEAFGQVTNLIDGIVSAAASKFSVESEVKSILGGMGTEARQMIDTVEVGLISAPVFVVYSL